MPPEHRDRTRPPLMALLIILTIGLWGLILSNQLLRIERLLEQRQVVIVPPDAIMVDEAPTPVSGP